MNADSNSNGSASDTPRPNERSSYSNLTEAEYLAHEAELAKTAISNALAELKSNLARAGNVKLWAHHYPWLTVGAAAATGFTLAAIVKGGSAEIVKGSGAETEGEEETRQRLVREAAQAPYDSREGAKKPKLGESLLGSLFSLARTALEASLVSAIRTEGVERASAGATAGAPPVNTAATTSGDGHSEHAASGRF